MISVPNRVFLIVAIIFAGLFLCPGMDISIDESQDGRRESTSISAGFPVPWCEFRRILVNDQVQHAAFQITFSPWPWLSGVAAVMLFQAWRQRQPRPVPLPATRSVTPTTRP